MRNSSAKRLAEYRGEKYVRTDSAYLNRHKLYKYADTRTGTRAMTKFKKHHFICWDGEGITDTLHSDIVTDSERINYQLYGLLMNNEGICKINTNGLTTDECLLTLINSTDDKYAIHVCFGASYDVNMMLRNIPEIDLRLLHSGESIDYKSYRLSYKARKSFEIKEYESIYQKFVFDEKSNKWERKYKKSIVLWDVFGFFQSSFIAALKSYFCSGNQLPLLKEKYLKIIDKIQEGKTRRGSFTEQELQDFVVPYCKLEVDALEELMQLLHSYICEANLEITRWDGAGAIAAAMLKKYGVKEHIDEKYIPNQVVINAEYAFFGGRIETLKYGNYENKVYHADINSAYPTEQEDIPSLKYGEWKHTQFIDNQEIKNSPKLTLCLVSWKSKLGLKTLIGPFPWRDKKDRVFFPGAGKGWVWLPEVLACIDTMSSGKHEVQLYIHETWSFYPTSDIKPYKFIREMYDFRKLLISRGSGAEKVVKLGLNSLYGKTAQSLGYDSKRKLKPPYHNLIIAGYVTSATRAKMVRVAMQNPSAIIMLATDGLYSTKPMNVPGANSTEKKLGEWEYQVHEWITIVVSGVYWYKSVDKEENAYSRGFDKYTLMRELVLNCWENNIDKLECETTRFVGLGSAIGLNNFRYWCTWRTIKRILIVNMSKVAKRTDSNSVINPRNGLRPTYASMPDILKDFAGYMYNDENNCLFPFHDGMLSNKYKFMWDTDNYELLDGINMREYLQEVANTTA